MDYKQFLVNLDFIKLKVFFNEKKNKILKTEILENDSKNLKETKNYVSELIKEYFYGHINKFDLSILNFDNLTDFQKDILIKLSEIPRGKVTTYKNLGEKIGRDRAYRAVGTSLAKNPFPIIIPCHRVIKSDLNVGNYSDGYDLKVKILKFEGVIFEKQFFVSKKSIL
ncbi:MAG TPA: MGMT family protein [Caldisericia bacterium]|nr:MGMT family protein [Caldisericia bacterium]HRU74181.1 MGMT family protein [Caldisericia bacterium]